MAYHRVWTAGTTVIGKGVQKNRVWTAGLTLLWKDQPYWGVDFDISVAGTAALSLGEPTYAQWIIDSLVPYTEVLQFNTEILQSHNRTEQRIARRGGIPRRFFDYKPRVPIAYWPQFDSIINKFAKRGWVLPIWADVVQCASALTAGATTIPVTTTYTHFTSGSFVVVFQDLDNWEITAADTIASGSITLAGTLANSYNAGAWIVPARMSYMANPLRVNLQHDAAYCEGSWIVDTLEDVTGFTAEQTYDSMTVLLDSSLLANEAHEQIHNPDIEFIDYETGPFTVVSNSDINEVAQPYRWRALTRADCWWLRQFIHDVNGRQKAFLVPTFQNDLTLLNAAGSGDTTLTVVDKDFSDNMGANRYRNYVGFYEDSTMRIRKISGIAAASGSPGEILTLDSSVDSTVGAAYAAGTKLCWIDKCRFASDTFELQWQSRDYLEFDAGLVRLP